VQTASPLSSNPHAHSIVQKHLHNLRLVGGDPTNTNDNEHPRASRTGPSW
jgi:hypothetical protein